MRLLIVKFFLVDQLQVFFLGIIVLKSTKLVAPFVQMSPQWAHTTTIKPLFLWTSLNRSPRTESKSRTPSLLWAGLGEGSTAQRWKMCSFDVCFLFTNVPLDLLSYALCLTLLPYHDMYSRCTCLDSNEEKPLLFLWWLLRPNLWRRHGVSTRSSSSLHFHV